MNWLIEVINNETNEELIILVISLMAISSLGNTEY